MSIEREVRCCVACGQTWPLGQYPPTCAEGWPFCFTEDTRRAAADSVADEVG